MTLTLQERLAGVILFAAVAFLAYTLSVTVMTAVVQQGCLEAGYPAGKVAWNFSRYCITRVDQTDRVIPYHQRGARP